MSINPSTAINKALSRAAGESYVAYKLARNGWMPSQLMAALMATGKPNGLDLEALRKEELKIVNPP